MSKSKIKTQTPPRKFLPVKITFEEDGNRDATFQPIKTVARVWGTDRKKVRRVVAHIVLTYRNHPTLVPGRPVWQARDEETSSPVAESFESPQALQEAVRKHYLKGRKQS